MHREPHPAATVASDTYQPTGALAACPACQAPVPGDLRPAAALVQAIFQWHCPGCGQAWSEHRTPAGSTRFWAPA